MIISHKPEFLQQGIGDYGQLSLEIFHSLKKKHLESLVES